MGDGIVLKDPFVSLGGTDISAYIKQIELRGNSYEKVDFTAGGDDAKWGKPGLAEWSVTVTCVQDFDDNGLDEIMFAIVGAAAASALVIRPTSAARGADNPEWTGNGRVFDYTPLSGAVGAGAETSFTIECGDGALLGRSNAA